MQISLHALPRWVFSSQKRITLYPAIESGSCVPCHHVWKAEDVSPILFFLYRGFTSRLLTRPDLASAPKPRPKPAPGFDDKDPRMSAFDNVEVEVSSNTGAVPGPVRSFNALFRNGQFQLLPKRMRRLGLMRPTPVQK